MDRREGAAADRHEHRYELVERIAVGGMAEVFKAKAYGAHGFEKILAIKRILPALARDAEFEARFITEAKLAVNLNHANVVQVFDFGRFGGSLYIAMEYVEGADLAALLRARRKRGLGPVPVGAALHMAMELLKGLDFAHRRGVVHRDVSPSNILLSRAGEVKVADFGIAQAAESSAGGQSASRRIMGKWRYMSPEQARGDRLDAGSDLFSAGVVLHELFTGERLFGGDDIESIVRAITDEELVLARDVRPDLPEGIDEVLGRMLERDREGRCHRASDVLKAFLEISYSRTLVATSMDVAEVVAETFPVAEAEAAGGRGSGGEGGRGVRLLDDIIRSEMAGKVVTESRVTERETVAGASTLRATFVAMGKGADGITVWELRTEPAAGAGAGEGEEGAAEGRGAPAGASVRRRMAPLVVAALLGAVAAAGAVAFFAEGSGEVVPVDGGGARGAAAADAPAVVARAPDAAAPRAVRLVVRSDPEGATVLFDGKVLGKTPLAREDVPFDEGAHALSLRKKGYAEHQASLRLTAPETTVTETLRPLVRYGTIDLYVEPWADVYFRGRKVGTAPIRDLRLPHGRHTLRLVNPVQNKETTFQVNVPSPTPYRVRLQGGTE